MVRPNLDARPADGEWSASEVFRHVRVANGIQAPRIIQVLIRPEAPLPFVDDGAWAERIRTTPLSIDRHLDAFEIGRSELVTVLRTLASGEWEMFGVHETLGRVTVFGIARLIVDHEAEHLRQLRDLAPLSGSASRREAR